MRRGRGESVGEGLGEEGGRKGDGRAGPYVRGWGRLTFKALFTSI